MKKLDEGIGFAKESMRFSQGGHVSKQDGLKPAGVVSSGYCINMQTGEVRDSIDDFLKDAKINKTEE